MHTRVLPPERRGGSDRVLESAAPNPHVCTHLGDVDVGLVQHLVHCRGSFRQLPCSYVAVLAPYSLPELGLMSCLCEGGSVGG